MFAKLRNVFVFINDLLPPIVIRSFLHIVIVHTQGLCEVVTRNRGLCDSVLNLYMRLLLACLSPTFVNHLKRSNPFSSSSATSSSSSQQQQPISVGPPLRLDDLVHMSADTAGEFIYKDHTVPCFALIIAGVFCLCTFVSPRETSLDPSPTIPPPRIYSSGACR